MIGPIGDRFSDAGRNRQGAPQQPQPAERVVGARDRQHRREAQQRDQVADELADDSRRAPQRQDAEHDVGKQQRQLGGEPRHGERVEPQDHQQQQRCRQQRGVDQLTQPSHRPGHRRGRPHQDTDAAAGEHRAAQERQADVSGLDDGIPGLQGHGGALFTVGSTTSGVIDRARAAADRATPACADRPRRRRNRRAPARTPNRGLRPA